jgi:hypothetical protein
MKVKLSEVKIGDIILYKGDYRVRTPLFGRVYNTFDSLGEIEVKWDNYHQNWIINHHNLARFVVFENEKEYLAYRLKHE